MKLNPDCSREILALLNKTENNIDFDDLCELLPNFSQDEIITASNQLAKDNYIEWNPVWADGILVYAEYYSLTISGLEYLEKSRNNSLWNKFKSYLHSLGINVSLEILKEFLLKFHRP